MDISREDVADVLARCLSTPEATGKTFEVQSLPGLDKVIQGPLVPHLSVLYTAHIVSLTT